MKIGFYGPKSMYFDKFEDYVKFKHLRVVLTWPCMTTGHDHCNQNWKATPKLDFMAQKHFDICIWSLYFRFLKSLCSLWSWSLEIDASTIHSGHLCSVIQWIWIFSDFARGFCEKCDFRICLQPLRTNWIRFRIHDFLDPIILPPCQSPP